MAKSMIFFRVAWSVSAAGARVARIPVGTMESAQATRSFSAFINAALAAISAFCSLAASGSDWYSASRGVENGVIFDLPKAPGGTPAPIRGAPGY